MAHSAVICACSAPQAASLRVSLCPQRICTGGRVLRSTRNFRHHFTHPEDIPKPVLRGRGGGKGADDPGGEEEQDDPGGEEEQGRGKGEVGRKEVGGFEAGQNY